MPIECLQEGDEVITRSQDNPSEAPRVGKVTRIFRDLAPAILWLTLGTGELMGVTPDHEVWSHEVGWTAAKSLSAGDAFAGVDRLPTLIVEMRLDPTPTPVFNLEVKGTFTYFADRVWVHNMSCRLLANVPEWALRGPTQYRSWLKRFQDPKRQPLADYLVAEMVEGARMFDMPIRGPEIGKTSKGSGLWSEVWHIHIGGFHIPCNSTFVP